MTTQAPEIQPEARLGQVVDERYRIVAHLGTGGMASVYQAEHVHTSAKVAIKVLHPTLNENAEIAGRFRREAQAARSVRHPHVVSVSDIGRLPDGCSYMVLEYIPGEDLFVLLHREKPLAQPRAVKIALQVASALVAAHAAGVVHRDLKPDNIMLIESEGDPDYVKVVDFGIAKVAAKTGPVLTTLGSVFGTPEYMSPEQARGAAADARTDLYTLGTVLYEMLSGRTPFAHEQFAQVLMGQIAKPPPPLPPEIDPELAALVMQLLEKDPSKRVQTAGELADHLQAILTRFTSPVPVAQPPAVPVKVPAPLPVNMQAPLPVNMQAPIAPTPRAGTNPSSSWLGWTIVVVFFLVAAFVLVRLFSAVF